jgi:flagellar biosynthesis protein FlhF
MKIKKFIAPTLPEALAKIKQDLGQDAVILKTRFNSSGSIGKGEKSVEVTAAIDASVESRVKVESQITAAIQPHNRILFDREPEQTPPIEKVQAPNEILDQIKKEIISLKHELEHSKSQTLFGQPAGMQLEVARRLVQKNIPEELTIEIVRRLASLAIDWDDIVAVKAETIRIISNLLSPGEPIAISDSGPSVVLLIGPTGAGKTSAAARLAFHYCIEKGIPITLISTDNFRADSGEQLKSLSKVIGCASIAISTPDELAVAIKSINTGLVIIDTTGFSNDKEIAELLPLTGAANANEIHLVVPVDIPACDLSRLVNGHPDLGINRIFVTKLDQSRQRGGVVAGSLKRGLKFSYQSASREMPGLFDLFNPEQFAGAFLSDAEAPEKEISDSLEVVGW